MTPPSPYRPDRSLPIAVALLVGGGLFAATAVYLLTTSAGTLTGPQRAGMAERQAQTQTQSAARRPIPQSAPTARSVPRGRGFGEAPFAASPPGRVPAWAGSGTPLPSPRSPERGLYDLRADMSHADLGPPSDGAGLGVTGVGPGGTGAPPSTGGLPDAGGTPLTADLGPGPSSKGTAWRSEASRLGNRARALSGALGQLDRSSRSAGGRTGASGTSGDASTASTRDGHRAPADPPDPPGDDDPPQVPVDGGLGWLAAAGAAYAANRLRKQQGAGDSDNQA